MKSQKYMYVHHMTLTKKVLKSNSVLETPCFPDLTVVIITTCMIYRNTIVQEHGNRF